MTADMLHVMEWHNGEKGFSPFSAAEMTRRQGGMRSWMAVNDVDAVLLTSHHCIAYFSGWLYCAFGRRYGMVLTQEAATTISAGVDGGQPWRRSCCRPWVSPEPCGWICLPKVYTLRCTGRSGAHTGLPGAGSRPTDCPQSPQW